MPGDSAWVSKCKVLSITLNALPFPGPVREGLGGASSAESIITHLSLHGQNILCPCKLSPLGHTVLRLSDSPGEHCFQLLMSGLKLTGNTHTPSKCVSSLRFQLVIFYSPVTHNMWVVISVNHTHIQPSFLAIIFTLLTQCQASERLFAFSVWPDRKQRLITAAAARTAL